MNNFITDIRAAVNMFTEIRKARKEGVAVEVRQCKQIEEYAGEPEPLRMVIRKYRKAAGADQIE